MEKLILLEDSFLQEFVVESNLIDPQPGHLNVPGDPCFDDHLKAARFVVSLATSGKRVSPITVHKLLMNNLIGMQVHAGKIRTVGVRVGSHICPQPWRLPGLLRKWLKEVKLCLETYKNATTAEKEKVVWYLHVEYEHIHPFIDGNGRSGRLLMLNHSLLLGLRPSIVKFNDRFDYYARLI